MGGGKNFMERNESGCSQATNREMFLDFLKENKLIHMNSQFQKPIEKKTTYREIGTDPMDREIGWDKFAEIGHCCAMKNGEIQLRTLRPPTNCTQIQTTTRY